MGFSFTHGNEKESAAAKSHAWVGITADHLQGASMSSRDPRVTHCPRHNSPSLAEEIGLASIMSSLAVKDFG